jgi:transcription antitermination factor NusG
LTQEHWYALHCKSRHERQVDARLQAQGFTTYLAEHETVAVWGARRRKVKKNILPGYVLVRAKMEAHTHLRILQTASVVKIVGRQWPRLSWIPDEQVESLRLMLGAKVPVEEVPYWNCGDRVEVVAGPLAGLRGYVTTNEPRRNRVIVSIDLLRRSVAVEVAAQLLRAAAPETER